MIKKLFPIAQHVNVPNTITSISLLASCAAIVLAPQKQHLVAALLVGVVVVGDGVDGAVARLLGQCSEFGRQLDSFSDFLGFVVAPAVQAYFLGLKHPVHLLFLGCYVLAGAWRLSRYNISGWSKDAGGDVQLGVGTTTAAGWFVTVIALSDIGALGHWGLGFFFALSPPLMISTVKEKRLGFMTVSTHLVMFCSMAYISFRLLVD